MGWKDAPLVEDTPKWASAPEVGQPSALSGIAKEGGKGMLRGASDLALMAPKAAGTMLFGPIGGELISRGVESIAAPSRELLKAAPQNKAEQFSGTAGEIIGGSIVGGGVGSLRGAALTGGAALGGATGEHVGGDLGKFLGILAGSYGASAAVAIGRKLGMTLADVGAVIGSGFGNKAGIERLASKAVTEKAGTDASRIREALKSPTEYVPGAKVTAGEAITEAQMGKPEQFGGAVVRLQRDIYGAKGVEDVLPSVARQQEGAIKTHLDALTERTGPMREKALDAANKSGGVRTGPLISKIEEMMSEPGKRASDVISRSLGQIKEKLSSLPQIEGRIDARDLYTVRKEIGNTIQTHAKETANWDKRLTSGLERSIQKHIDDAIEMAGGTGWKSYLATESSGRQAVDNLIARQKSMKLIQSGVKGQPSANLVAGEIPQPPTLLSRPMMLINYGLKQISIDANTPVVKRVATDMQDPQKFAELIKLPLNHPDRKALHYVLNALVATKLDQSVKENQP